jgi:hypothetical protein
VILLCRLATSDISYTSYGCFAPDTSFTDFTPCIPDAAGVVSYKGFCSQPIQNHVHLDSGIVFYSDPNCANKITDSSSRTTSLTLQCGFIDYLMLPNITVASQVSINCSNTSGYYGVRTLSGKKLTPSLASSYCFSGPGAFASAKVSCAVTTQYQAFNYINSNTCSAGEQLLSSTVKNLAFVSVADGFNVIQASCAKVAKQGVFLAAPNFPIGLLPQLTTTIVPTGAQRKVTVTTSRGQKVKVLATLTALPFSFAPSIEASNLLYRVPSRSTIKITIGPTAPAAPIYLYAFRWPRGTYTWSLGNWTVKSSSKQSTIKPALKQIKVASGTTKTFSGILEFPAGTGVIRWKGNLTSATTFVRFTLGYVVPKNV